MEVEEMGMASSPLQLDIEAEMEAIHESFSARNQPPQQRSEIFFQKAFCLTERQIGSTSLYFSRFCALPWKVPMPIRINFRSTRLNYSDDLCAVSIQFGALPIPT
jgi:hypothetical protein